MNKLWVRLTVAFGLVVLVTILTVAMLTNRQVGRQFNQFMIHNQMDSPLQEALTDHFVAQSSWNGVETVFENWPHNGRGMGKMANQQTGFLLTDSRGQVVYDTTDDYVSPTNQQDSFPVEYDNQVVGYLWMDGNSAALSPAGELFLRQINIALLQTGLLAGLLGVLLGVFVARTLSAPLGRLATAAKAIAEGDFEQRVPVQGAEELAELAETFNHMATQLQTAEALRRNMVADVAHELRTPLSVIQGNLQAILDDVFPLDKAEIASIHEESLILGRLIADLRELAQAEAGQLSLTLESTDLAALLYQHGNLFKELTNEEQVTLRFDLPADLPHVLADSGRTTQVVHNLLSNALRHTPPHGEIVVQAECSAPDTVRVSVTDSGTGIAEADIPHLFSRFWRADKSRAREHGGSGLGLAISQQLIQHQGGQIGVTSNVEQGSCFWFTLPIA
ncbi:ATP-binding protein [Anaerolineales bacterium HSG25]|nr:ATP-binding protein [Anaerolineales bacterium HSG25]